MKRITKKIFPDTMKFLEFVEKQKKEALLKGPLGPNNLIDLRNVRLDVEKPWFSFVDLSWCHFKKINLQGANFKEANLQGVRFEESDLSGADLSGAHLQGAQLQGIQLQLCQMDNANLRVANLRSADLRGSSVVDCNLQFANLQGSFLQRIDLSKSNLQGSNLQGADLQKAKMHRTILTGASMQWSDLQSANLREADLHECDFQEANLKRADFTGAKLEGINTKKAVLTGAKGLQAHLHSLTVTKPLAPLRLGRVHSNYKYASLRDQLILRFLSHYYKINSKAPPISQKDYPELIKKLEYFLNEHLANRTNNTIAFDPRALRNILTSLKTLLELDPNTVKIYDVLTVVLPFIENVGLFKFRNSLLLRYFPDPPTADIFKKTICGLWISHSLVKVSKELSEAKILSQSPDAINNIFENMLLGLKGIWKSVDFVLTIAAFSSDEKVIYHCLRKKKVMFNIVNDLRSKGIPKDPSFDSDDPFVVGTGPTHKPVMIESCKKIVIEYIQDEIVKFSKYDPLSFAAFQKARVHYKRDILFYIEKFLTKTLDGIEYIYLTEEEEKAAKNGKSHVKGASLRFYIHQILRTI